MHGCGVYERWTHIQLPRAIDEQQFCERDAVWLSMEGGRGPLASCPYPIVALLECSMTLRVRARPRVGLWAYVV